MKGTSRQSRISREGAAGSSTLRWLGLAAILIAADQLAKAAARGLPDEGIKVLPLLSLVNVGNTGSLFGILKGSQPYLIALSAAVIAVIALTWKGLKGRMERAAATLILAGIIGNTIDRLARGEVTDFIALPFWPAFNLADAFMTIGVVCAVIMAIKKKSG